MPSEAKRGETSGTYRWAIAPALKSADCMATVSQRPVGPPLGSVLLNTGVVRTAGNTCPYLNDPDALSIASSHRLNSIWDQFLEERLEAGSQPGDLAFREFIGAQHHRLTPFSIPIRKAAREVKNRIDVRSIAAIHCRPVSQNPHARPTDMEWVIKN